LALLYPSRQYFRGEGILNEGLNGSLKRPRAEERIEAGVRKYGLGFFGNHELYLAIGHAAREEGELNIDYREYAVLAEALEDDGLVDAVDELGLEARA
jgi:hypothetical protein